MKPSRLWIALSFSALLPALALAQSGSLGQRLQDEDARFEEAIRDFGFTSGAAWQCSAPEAQSGVESEVMRAYAGLVRLFGTDRAFFYAAAFGAGTGMAIDKGKCAEYIADFRKAMKSQGKGQ